MRGHIERVGRALTEIFEIEQAVYALRPELKPAKLKESSTDSGANKLLCSYLSEAIELEDAGRKGEAIEKLREFLSRESPPLHREIANNEILRLSDE